MKKKLMILAIAMTATVNASAQIEAESWYVTPKAGVTVADLTGKLFDATKAEGTYDATLRPLVNFTIGADIMYAFTDNLGLAGGINFSRQGAKTKDDLFKVSLDYFNIPITLNYYPIAKAGLALKAGVQVGFATHKRLKMDGVNYNADYDRVYYVNRYGWIRPGYVESELSRQFNKVDFSIPLAVSYEISGIMLEARYNLGLTNIMKEDPENSKNRVWQFTLGYKFDLGD